MATLKPAAIEIFNQYSTLINKCRKEIVSLPWFGSKWWVNVSFGNPGFVFQISKTHWFNHLGQGIHFEYWLGEMEHQRKALPFVLHFEPDTPERKALGVLFKTAFSEMERDFSDYSINYRAICDKLQKFEKFTKNTFPQLVISEFSRLQKIAPLIDRILIAQFGEEKMVI